MLKTEDIQCKCIERYKNKLYILTRFTNDLLVYDTISKELSYIACIKNEQEIYTCSCIKNDRVYFFPYEGNLMCVYNIVEDHLEYHKILNEECTSVKSISCFNYNNSIYIICGNNNSPLINFDVDVVHFQIVDNWAAEYYKKYGKKITGSIYTNPCIKDDKLWMPLNEPDLILEYSLIDGEYQIHDLHKYGIRYRTINYSQGQFWLTGDRKAIVKWNNKNGHMSIFEDFPDEFEYVKNSSGWDGLFYNAIESGDEMCFFPLDGNGIIKLNCLNEKIELLDTVFEGLYCLHCFRVDNDQIYFEMDANGCLERKKSYLFEMPNTITDFSFESNKVKVKGDILKGEKKNMFFYEKYNGMLQAYLKLI